MIASSMQKKVTRLVVAYVSLCKLELSSKSSYLEFLHSDSERVLMYGVEISTKSSSRFLLANQAFSVA